MTRNIRTEGIAAVLGVVALSCSSGSAVAPEAPGVAIVGDDCCQIAEPGPAPHLQTPSNQTE